MDDVLETTAAAAVTTNGDILTTAAQSTAKVWKGASGDVGALVWIFLAIYLMFLLILSAWSYWKNDVKEKMSSKTMKDQIENHYLGNRNFSDIVIVLSVMATVYSGYTVVGVPEEMYRYGFYSYRWLFCVGLMNFPIGFFFCRIQYLSSLRDYVSPIDFIKDRFNSHILKNLLSTYLCFAAIIYVLAQFKSMGGTVEALSNGDIKALTASSIFCVIMLLYEIFGGLRAIAYTDALQGGILFLGFLLFFAVQEELFGGVKEAGIYMENLGLNRLLTEDQIQGWFGFTMPLFFAFCMYPQLVQRYQSSKATHQVRKTVITLTFGHWLAMTSSLCTGMVAIKYFGFRNPNIGPSQAFGSMMRETMAEGPVYNILGSIMTTSSVAAFMSTADSALHGFTCCIVLDLIKPYPHFYKFFSQEPKWEPCEIMYISKIISIGFAIMALLLSDTDFELGALLTMQNAVLCQAFPAFSLGFTWKDAKPFGLIIGAIFGASYTLAIQCMDTEDCVQAGVEWYEPIDGIHPSMFALFINFMIAVIFSLVEKFSAYNLQPNFDVIEASHDFPEELIGVNVEPFITPFQWPYNIAPILVLIMTVFSVPFYRSDDWGKPEDFFGGIPRYVRDGYIIAGVGGILWIVICLTMWGDEPEGFKKKGDKDVEEEKSNESIEMENSKRTPESGI